MPSPFGLELRRLRRQAGFSLRSLAKQVGVDFTYLSKIETSVLRPPATATIEKLARALRQSPEPLLHLARKVPRDVSAIVLENEHIPAFLRMASRQRLTETEWEELTCFLARRRLNVYTATALPRRREAINTLESVLNGAKWSRPTSQVV